MQSIQSCDRFQLLSKHVIKWFSNLTSSFVFTLYRNIMFRLLWIIEHKHLSHGIQDTSHNHTCQSIVDIRHKDAKYDVYDRSKLSKSHVDGKGTVAEQTDISDILSGEHQINSGQLLAKQPSIISLNQIADSDFKHKRADDDTDLDKAVLTQALHQLYKAEENFNSSCTNNNQHLVKSLPVVSV